MNGELNYATVRVGDRTSARILSGDAVGIIVFIHRETGYLGFTGMGRVPSREEAERIVGGLEFAKAAYVNLGLQDATRLPPGWREDTDQGDIDP